MMQKRSSRRPTGAREVSIPVMLGRSADRDVVVGFASARVLSEFSFADVLDESTGQGYQRRFNPAHSKDFRRYIRKPGSTTIPLTFNLRPPLGGAACAWRIVPGRKGEGTLLVFRAGLGRPLSQVDCQHRLGKIDDLDLLLPFMSFIGLNEREELEIFSIINSKAKGLRGSLLDYHAARLTDDLAQERPELYVALYLHESERSPWHQQLDLGGKQTVGLARRASLRTMQKAVKRFLGATGAHSAGVPTPEIARVVLEFWQAVAAVLPGQWGNPRKHFLNKGVGVYALMGMLGDLWNEHAGSTEKLDRAHFESVLSRFARDFDWSTSGPLKGLGGESGVKEAIGLLRQERTRGAARRTPHAPRKPRVTKRTSDAHA